MKTHIDFSSIFDTAMPNAYIRKVSLLPSTMTGRSNGVSYDEEQEDGLEKNIYGKKKAKKNRPRFKDVTNSSKSLKIKVEIALKDSRKKSGRSRWFENEELLNLLKLKVVLCKNLKVIERLENGHFTPKALKQLKVKNQIIEKIIDLRKNFRPNLETQKIEKIGGRTVFCVTYTAVFEISNYRPRNLSIFTSTFIDLNQAALNKSRFVESNRRFLQGPVQSESLIRDGSVQESGHVFLLPNKKLWAGPVHHSEKKGYMAGAFHLSERHPRLNRKNVPNFIVEDYRLLEAAEEARLLLRPVRKRRGKRLQNRSARRTKLVRRETFVSEPEYSYNATNELSFLFHLDYHKAVIDNSQFGAFVRTADRRAKENIFSNSKIKNVRIFRHRVEQGLRANEIREVEYEDRTELVAYSFDTASGFLRRRRVKRPIQPNEAGSEMITIGGIREVNLGFNRRQGIRTFTISDFDMASRTDGRYRYSAEFEIEDGTIPFVKKELAKIVQVRSFLTEYYNVASRRENNDMSTGHFSDAFIEKLANAYQIPEREKIINSNRRNRKQLVQKSIASSPWLNAVSVYTGVLNNLTTIQRERALDISFLLLKLVDPSTGSVQGLELLLNLIESLERKIKNVLGDKDRMMNEQDYGIRTTAYKNKMVNNSISIKKKFKRIHDSNTQNYVGYDFLGGREGRGLGLRSITTKYYKARLLKEHQKYFSGMEAAKDPNRTRAGQEGQDREARDQGQGNFAQFLDLKDSFYSYLTPFRIRLGKGYNLKLVDRGPALWRTRQYDAMASSKLALNPRRDSLANAKNTNRSPREPTFDIEPPITFSAAHDATVSGVDKEVASINIANSVVMSSLGVQIMSPTSYAHSIVMEEQAEGISPEVYGVDPKEIIGESTSFATDKFETLEPTTLIPEEDDVEDITEFASLFTKPLVSSEENLFSVSRFGVLDFNPRNKKNRIDKIINKFDDAQSKARFFEKIPNQIKSIFMSSRNKTIMDWFATLRKTGQDLIESPKYANLYYYNYNHINSIEVLIGFGEDKDGNPLLSEPRYRRMNKRIFDRVSKTGRPIVCRMMPYSFRAMGIKKSKKLELPEFDRFFFLRPPQQIDEEEIEEAITAIEEEEVPSEEDIFVTRLTEYADMNSTGLAVLRSLIKRKRQQARIPPEFITTAFVTQPDLVSRVGTKFGTREEPAAKRGSSSGVAEALTRRRSSTSMPEPRGGGGY